MPPRSLPLTSTTSHSSFASLPLCVRQSIQRPLQRVPFLPSTLQHRAATQVSPSQIIRPLVPPPGEKDGPLLERLPNRALPNPPQSPFRTWARTLPIFVLIITVCALGIFNYQKLSSSTVASILYALRTNPQARELLGDEIYFASKVPWVRGEMNQVHGRIDVSFWVSGTKGKGKTRFVSRRLKRGGFFETLEWNLTMEDGRTVQLLDKKEATEVMGRVKEAAEER